MSCGNQGTLVMERNRAEKVAARQAGACEDKELEFPLTWFGSLITEATAGDVSPLLSAIFAELGLSGASVEPGRVSSGGKYLTWNIKAHVPDLPTFRRLTAEISKVPGTRMLI